MTAEYLRNTDTDYLIKNENLGKSFCPPLWVGATQQEIDAYLLVNAKVSKNIALNVAREAFCAAGFLYSGDTFSTSDGSTGNMLLKDHLLSFESNNVNADNTGASHYGLPPGHGLAAADGQLIAVSGFTEGANNGNKTVVSLEGDFLMVDGLVDEDAGDNICIACVNRYEYYDIDDVQVDFVNETAWRGFFNAIITEKDRIMRYYCATKKEIKDAADMTTLNAITINFSA
jgi:hypothetical protein